MRILLAGGVFARESTGAEINAYLAADASVVANMHGWDPADRSFVHEQFSAYSGIAYADFDPMNPAALLAEVSRDELGFDAIVCAPPEPIITPSVLMSIIQNADLRLRLRAIGCPNDSTSHLVDIAKLAADNAIAIVHTPGVHANAVAEYVLMQIAFHARNYERFYDLTGRNGAWPHSASGISTRALRGRTLGIIGGAGKDGTATLLLALKLNMTVIAIGSGAPAGDERIRNLGAIVAPDLDHLLERADYLSINCRNDHRTEGMIGPEQIARMKAHVIIINPAGAEILDKQAIMDQFSKRPEDRRIGTLILDMPYGRERDNNAFSADPVNAILKNNGVLFTPRMAGYTLETKIEAATDLAGHVVRFLQSGTDGIPIANGVNYA